MSLFLKKGNLITVVDYKVIDYLSTLERKKKH